MRSSGRRAVRAAAQLRQCADPGGRDFREVARLAGHGPDVCATTYAHLFDELRHAFASLLIHEGRLSVVEIAAQLGHNPTVCLDTYAHVMAEERDGEHVSAQDQIAQARAGLDSAEPDEAQLTVDGIEW